ncbi:MAG: class B sortase [Clostridia bacterium]|nr:class B sortase [Clostridia bacterium]
MAENKNMKESKFQQSETGSSKASHKKKVSAGDIIRTVVLVLCIGVFGFSVFKICSDLFDDSSTGDEYNELLEIGRNPTDPGDETVDPEVKDPENNGKENTDNSSEDNTDPPAVEPTEPSDIYDDQNAEEASKDQTQNQIVVVTRPNASLDKTDLSVIHPNDISLEDIAYVSNVDFESLKERNSDVVAWICIPGNDSITGLPIDTAVVQTTDNEFYLDHSFDKTENVNGWIFADYRNNMEKITANYNTIIYGHARSYRMFGGLKNLNATPEWYKNGYNHFIKITTPNDETIWQIFSWYETDIYYNYIRTSFSSPEEFIAFATELQDKNELKGYFSTFEFNENSRILTLSTCKGSNPANRVAVHAVLVARKP